MSIWSALNSVLVNDPHMGEAVTYKRTATGVSTAIRGCRSTTPGESTAPGTNTSIFVCVSSLTAEPVAGDEVTIGTRIYKVADVRRDEVGDGAYLALVYDRAA